MDSTQNGSYATFRFSEKTREVLGRHKEAFPDRPFFLYYAMQNVHGPLESPSEWLSKEPCASIATATRQIFCGQALLADGALKKLMQAIDDFFPGEDVLLIVSGDNGGEPQDGGNNLPLRGKKATLWEGGIRNNAFVWSNTPALLPADRRGLVYNGLMHVSDWHATIVEVAGGAKDDIDGMSHLSAFQGASLPPRSEFLVNIDPHAGGAGPDDAGNEIEAAYRMGDWKLLLNVAPETFYPVSGAAAEVGKTRVDALFNVTDDPHESNNVYDDHPEVVATIRAKISALSSEQLYPCNCGAYCIHGVSECAYDAGAISAAAAAGGWVPWLSEPLLV